MYKCCSSSADVCINVMFVSPFPIWKKIVCPGRHGFIKGLIWPVYEIIDNSCVKGPQDVFSPTSSSKQGQLWGQVNLLRTFCRWVLKTSKSGASITSLGSLLHCCVFLVGKRFVNRLNLSDLKLCLPPCTTRSSLQLSPLYFCSTGRLLLDPPKVMPFSGWTRHAPSASPHSASAPYTEVLVVSTEPASVYQYLSHIEGLKTENNLFPVLTGHDLVSTALNAIGSLCFQGTLLAYAQLHAC